MIAALALFAAAQLRTDLPQIVYELPVTGGQREIILGAKPVQSTVLNGYFERDFAPKNQATGDNTGGFVDSWIPGGTHEENLGNFDCSTVATTLFDKPCVLITSTAKWNQKMGRKPNEVSWQN